MTNRPPPVFEANVRIFKRLRRPGIDSKESIPPAYKARRAGTTDRVIVRSYQPARLHMLAESIPGLLKRLKIRALKDKAADMAL